MKMSQRTEAEKTNEYNRPLPKTSLLCFLAAKCIQRNGETYRHRDYLDFQLDVMTKTPITMR